MKKLMSIIWGLILLGSLTTWNSCKKDDNNEYQPKGNYGNANVTSQTFTVATWSATSSMFYTHLNVSNLTADVQNKGAVMAYFSINDGTNWNALPCTFYSSSNHYTMSFLTAINLVEVRWTNANGIAYTGNDPNTMYGAICKIKIVLIEPAAWLAHPDVDLKNFEEVKSTFNLAD